MGIAVKALSLFMGCTIILCGCHVESYTVSDTTSVTDNGPNAGTVTSSVGVSVTIKPNVSISNVQASDIPTIPATGFGISVSALNAEFTADTTNSPYAVVSALTDSGYTSQITVPLTPTEALINPVNPGDAVTSYSLQDTAAFETWTQVVSQHTQSTATISAVGYLPFLAAQTPGTYTVSNQVTNNVTAPSSVAQAQVSIASPPPPTCGVGKTKCYQP